MASKHSACQRLTAVKNRHSTLLNRIPTPLTIFGRKHLRESPQTSEASVISPFSPQQEPGELPDPQRPLVVRGQNSQMEGGGSTFHVDKRLDFHRVACEVVKINLVEGRFHMRRSDRYILLCIR